MAQNYMFQYIGVVNYAKSVAQTRFTVQLQSMLIMKIIKLNYS